MGKVQLTHSYETFLRPRIWVRIPGNGFHLFFEGEKTSLITPSCGFFLLPEAGMLFTGVGQCLRNAASVAGKWFLSPEGSSKAKLQTRGGVGGQGWRGKVHFLKTSNKQTDKSCREAN